MGEVYRATDTKLKRQVAIKILPPALAADQVRWLRRVRLVRGVQCGSPVRQVRLINRSRRGITSPAMTQLPSPPARLGDYDITGQIGVGGPPSPACEGCASWSLAFPNDTDFPS